ncbi:hypothetical protein Rsub_08866 [Raphidocelis subcapitata]|uniref:Uncharacterized protein n=1 Tax=Raphidocelis subcapitata TaxID=307507 RepID=A0A2V0P856_9CHLO|nr:hypothetical protein Rsub_08866 [Raphidocelis subcapitata]|eukprot:GBF96051.1 hypothetical protein Rsub_08866 [Raphidocelis subcapitata]
MQSAFAQNTAAPRRPRAGAARSPPTAAAAAAAAPRRRLPVAPAALRRGVAEDLSVPAAIVDQIAAANAAWIDDALQRPLVHAATGARVYLATACCWAPLQWEVVRGVIDKAAPTLVALEAPQPPAPQPPAPGAAATTAAAPPGAADGAPAWVASFLANFDPLVCEPNLSPSLPSAAPPARALEALRAELEAAAAPLAAARVGRDVLDPDEHFGLYPHNELARFPGRVLDAWELLGERGYMPGMEHVAAAQLARQRGAPLVALDAPLALQEAWVSGLLSEFDARRRDPSRQPRPYELMRDAHTLLARLPPGLARWDERLGAAFAGLGPSALLAFKLARAAAAATLAPDDVPAVAVRLRRLQPLKWAHFGRRELHMAWRLRELCESGAAGAGPGAGAGSDSGGRGSAASNSSSGGSSSSSSSSSGGSSSGSSSGGGTSSSGPVIVALVGRQHAAALRALWEDAASPLWRDRVPREFAPSAIEELNARAAAMDDAGAGGGGGGGGGGGSSIPGVDLPGSGAAAAGAGGGREA